MSASYSASGKPAWAITCWVDDSFVYTEIPCTDGPPLITKHAFSEAGLSKALGMMRDLHRKLAPQGGYHKLVPHPIVNKTIKRGKMIQPTDEQRKMVHDILKKSGIIK
jgi:hypothetical protein